MKYNDLQNWEQNWNHDTDYNIMMAHDFDIDHDINMI